MDLFNAIANEAKNVGYKHFLKNNIGDGETIIKSDEVCGLKFVLVSYNSNKIMYCIRQFTLSSLNRARETIEYFRDKDSQKKIERRLKHLAKKENAVPVVVEQVVLFDFQIDSTMSFFGNSMSVESTNMRAI